MNPSFSAKTLLIGFISFGLALVLAANFALYFQGKHIQQQVAEQALKHAENELAQAIETSLRQVRFELNQLVEWDDVHQQLDQPSYYYYWHQQRLKQSGKFMPYYHQLELYNPAGQKLTAINQAQPNVLPAQLSEANRYIAAPFTNQEFYIHYQAVYQRSNPDKLLGYVAIAVNFYQLLGALNQFYYLDFKNLYFSRTGHIEPEQLLEVLVYQSVATPVNDQLWQLIEQFVGIFIVISFLAALIVFGFIQHFFLRPLSKVGQFLHRLKSQPDQPAQDTAPPVILKECQLLKTQLKGYHNALLESQAQLKQTNLQLQQLSLTDHHTGIGNQRALEQVWQRYLEAHSIAPKSMGYLMLDCRNFREIVESRGYKASEQIVKTWVERLQNLHPNFQLFRVGADKLVIMVEQIDKETLDALAQIILQQLQQPDANTLSETFNFCIGGCFLDTNQSIISMRKMPKQTDFALFRAKKTLDQPIQILAVEDD
jgi:diguanylate cyclase (GGDEF)-like protein